jgi:hypothetical protein
MHMMSMNIKDIIIATYRSCLLNLGGINDRSGLDGNGNSGLDFGRLECLDGGNGEGLRSRHYSKYAKCGLIERIVRTTRD